MDVTFNELLEAVAEVSRRYRGTGLIPPPVASSVLIRSLDDIPLQWSNSVSPVPREPRMTLFGIPLDVDDEIPVGVFRLETA